MNQDSQRLVLFIILSVGILFVWGIMFPQPVRKPTKGKLAKIQGKKHKGKKSKGKTANKGKKSKSKTTAKAAQPQLKPATSQPTSMAASRPTSMAAARAAGVKARPAVRRPAPKMPKASNKTLTYKGERFKAQILADGGAIKAWRLNKFRDQSDKNKKARLNLVRTRGGKLPFTEKLLDKRLLSHKHVPYMHINQPKKNIIRVWGRVASAKGGYVEIEKQYIFNAKTYRFDITYTLTNKTTHDINTKMSWRLEDRENPKSLQGGMFSYQTEQLHMLCQYGPKSAQKQPKRVDFLKMLTKVQKLQKKTPSKAPNSIYVTELVPSTVGFMSIDRRYFSMAIMPQWGKQDRGTGCSFKANAYGRVIAKFTNAGQSIAPGASKTIKMGAYFGPKYYENLKQAGSTLETSIDFGWFAFLCRPMLMVMQFIYNGLSSIGAGNWGIVIILLTLLVKLLTLPLTNKSMQSMKAMQRLKPEMDRIKEKYGDDKEAAQRETMNLYVKHGINPLAGCLPMLLQMPIWIALYQTILFSVEMYQATFIPGWIDDLSSKDPIFVLPLALGASMFLQQKLTPQTLDNAQAQIMGYMMPIFFTFIMLFLPAGLTLYIFVNTVLGVAHQWYIYQQPDKEEPPDKKKPTRKGWMQRMQEYAEEQQQKQQSK